MAIRMNPELAAILAAADSQYEQVRLLDAALTANKRIKAKRVANASTPQSDVWANGTLFRDAALNGAFTFQGVEIIGYGVTSDLTTCLPADVSTGISVMRIEGGEHWIEGRFGLQADAEGNPDIDFTFPTNPTATNSIAIAGTFRLRANQALPDGTPDTIAPTVSLSVPSNTVSVAGGFPLTANVSDNVGVTSVAFYRDTTLLGTINNAPWSYTEQIPSSRLGTFSYTAVARDAAGNSTTSAAQSVTVDIVETGPATAIGSELTTISMQNTDASTQTNIPVTFGQVFSVGALPATDAAVELRAPDNSIVPCQLDVKATHQDGSVRHAIISAVLPSLGASESRTFSILRKASPIGGAAAIPSDFSGLNAVATIVDTGTDAAGPNAGTTYTADAAPLLAAGTYQTWLSGPICSEWIVRAPLKTAGGVEHPDLHARFEIRAYKGQAKARVHYIIENNWAKPRTGATSGSAWESVSNTDKVYRVSLKAGTNDVYVHNTKGKVGIDFKHPSGTYDGNKTGLANDSTVYTASVSVDGVNKSLSVTGSTAQTFAQLFSTLNSQLGGATVVRDEGVGGIEIVANSSGPTSKIRVTNVGTLFPPMRATGYANNSTAYTGTVTVNGSTVINLSVTGSQAQHIGQLCALMNVQMAGVATATPVATGNGVELRSVSTGQVSDVVITTPGTLFMPNGTSLAPVIVYRPLDGDETAHYARTGWIKTFWWGSEPPLHVVHNKNYLITTKALPKYQGDIVPDSATITNNYTNLNANEGIGRNGITKAGMGDVGYAPGIGILPEWTALWLLSQDKDAKYTMLRQAQLMRSWPVCFRDYNTDRPISLADWPRATITGAVGDSHNSTTNLTEQFPARVASALPPSRMVPDVSHHPDFNFVPYLVTGDHCYMEGMLFYQRFCVISQNPTAAYRDGSKGLWWREQVRGQGWSFRASLHANYLIPDAHPLKPDLVSNLEQNIAWYDANVVPSGAPYHNVLGFIVNGTAFPYSEGGGSANGVAPWQDDFVTTALGRGLELGFKKLAPLFRYKAKSPIGRLTSSPAYCWQAAAAYQVALKDNSDTPLYATWGEVYQKSMTSGVLAATCGTQAMADALAASSDFPSTPATLNVLANRSADPGSYTAILQMALAYTVTHSATGANDAWLVFDGRSVKPVYNAVPQFAIVPRP